MFWSAKLVSNVFISCSYYCEAKQRVLTKISIAVISEPSDHSLTASFNWTNVIVNELKMRMKNSSTKVILWSDGCSSQCCTKYVFVLMTNLDKSVQSEWHFNEANHWKDPGDCVSGTIKRVVFGLVQSNKITIYTAEGFVTEASKTVPSIQSICLPEDDEIIEPLFVKVTPYIQGTLDTNNMKRSSKFYRSSNDLEPFHVQYHSCSKYSCVRSYRFIRATKMSVVFVKNFFMEIIRAFRRNVLRARYDSMKNLLEWKMTFQLTLEMCHLN